MNYLQLEQQLMAWADTQPALRAGVVIGSRARLTHPADEWSDLDCIFFMTETAPYAADYAWLAQFGPVWAAVANRTGRGDPEWMLLYAGGLKLDVVLSQIEADAPLPQLLERSPYMYVARPGVRVLFDKNPSPHPLHLDASDAAPLPNEQEFTTLIYKVFMDSTRIAKLLRRGELWRAKQQCDGTLKAHLLEMLAWHAQIVYGVDTWYDGHYMEEWADARWQAALPETFALYSTADVQRALWASLGLFSRMAAEVALQLDFTHPQQIEDEVIAWLHSILG